MRLHSRSIVPQVERDPAAHRPVILRMVGLYFAMTTEEARQLADQLHDAAEGVTE